MIGTLTPLSLTAAEQTRYRATQCALCHHLGARYGLTYRLFAGPDAVFLAIYRASLRGERPRIGRRSCVVAPGITRLPVREDDDDIAFAAAYGVYMAVEKLRDDLLDEGGWWRWLMFRAFARGQDMAAAELTRQGFDIAAVRAELDRQQALEASAQTCLEAAAAPTRTIAGQLFAHDAPAAQASARRALGEAVGGYLFWLDNLLDAGRDEEQGAYNALLRAHGRDALTPGVQSEALADAARDVTRAREALAALPSVPQSTYLRSVVEGFGARLARYRQLEPAARLTATLRDLTPRRRPLRRLLRVRWARHPLQLKLRVATALTLAWLFPHRSWAQDALDTGDTGLASEPTPLEEIIGSTVAMHDDDPCTAALDFFLGSFCYADLNCDATCGDVCDDVCSDACDVSC